MARAGNGGTTTALSRTMAPVLDIALQAAFDIGSQADAGAAPGAPPGGADGFTAE